MCSTQQLEIKAIQYLACIWIGMTTFNCSAEDPMNAFIKQVHLFTESLVQQAHPDATRIKINIKSPDQRISLDDCQVPRISQHGTQQLRSRILLKIECPQSLALHLPVDIAVYKPIVVAAVALSRQTLLSEDDLVLQDTDILLNNRAMFENVADATGKRLKRSVRTGTIITRAMLIEPTLINRGDSIVIIAAKGSLVVRMPGIALEDGTMGKQIKVRNPSSERVVSGWVRSPGEVHVPL